MNKLILSVAVLAALFTSCNDDDNHFNASPETTKAFNSMYPNATKIEWEQEGIYTVAEFDYKGIESEAWFDSNGKWFVTESDIVYTMLPEEVKAALKASDYATWRVDNVDLLERRDLESIYIVEVELGETDKDLHYSPTGELLKTVAADNDNHYEYFPE
jgi:hypothetical protein